MNDIKNNKDEQKERNTFADRFASAHLNTIQNKRLPWKDFRQKKKEYKEAKVLKEFKKQEKKQIQSEENVSVKVDECTTISIAVPGSILDICQTRELKAYVVGQIARAASIFKVNEIIVYNETNIENVEDEEEKLKLSKEGRGTSLMIKILQYLECPQYLRKFFFPMHSDLHYVGLLNPLDSPHHLRADEKSRFREGITVNMPVGSGKGSYVYVGLKKKAVIDKLLKPNTRVTVMLDPDNASRKRLRGKAVSPITPLKLENCYWGYQVRFAPSLNSVISRCPFKGGYDVTIGTSDKGQNYKEVSFPIYR
ncbi:putative methyltransferase C9orf114 [Trichonephila clavipes]|nr:putative methyltransferase C9orf114 [Trichonephila clavipes]